MAVENFAKSPHEIGFRNEYFSSVNYREPLNMDKDGCCFTCVYHELTKADPGVSPLLCCHEKLMKAFNELVVKAEKDWDLNIPGDYLRLVYPTFTCDLNKRSH